ncbi:MAG: GDSL-type esterase/lipase family protein [Phycisphaerales bacterium]
MMLLSGFGGSFRADESEGGRLVQSGEPPRSSPAPRSIAETPAARPDTMARHEQFNAIAQRGEAKLVFVGDSITQGWEGPGKAEWARRFAPRHAANFGISGDRTEHVLWRIDHGNFDHFSPTLIVLMIGTNNTGHRMDPARDTAAGVRAIIDRLKSKCPRARLLILGIFPRGDNADDPMRRRNDEVNAIVRTFADDATIFYRDIGSAFLMPDDAPAPAEAGAKKGRLKPGLMPDKLHLSEEGYGVWGEAIERDVARLMDEQK